MVSDYTLNRSPLKSTFAPGNVLLQNGVLQMIVRGGTTSGAEIETKFQLQYANITTRARISSVPGTCAATFFYKSDNNEVDIEFLSSYIQTGSADGGIPAGLALTNQALSPSVKATSSFKDTAFDPTTGFHDYTIVWTAGETRFYADGQLLDTFTTNVPSTSGSWIWNNWSSGDLGWSAGPPTSDNIYEIASISGYYFPA